ncbi:MAG: EF-P lysine aminoacylase GenX [Alphaproteobacteria bacterium]|nr:EF-P lysine aminoacylase GenX [Alphaproteobacteria bacterium]
MSWWQPQEFAKKRPFLEKRAEIVQGLRGFFGSHGFLEVNTPVLQVCPVMDTHSHAFETILKNPDLSPAKTLYLQTSPEFDMKKLMVAGVEKLYQICPVFRNAEGSRLHSPEFTMLEWYRAQDDYSALIDDCIALLRHLAQGTGFQYYQYKGLCCDPFAEWQVISVADAFAHYAGIHLDDFLEDTEGFAAAVREAGIRVAEGDRWDDLFFAVMAEKIEPKLGAEVPAILFDYPASLASLSRRKPEDPRYAERFELYVCGVELANAFSELTDAAEQRQRFIDEMDLKKKLYNESYPADEEFLRALEYGLPDSAGIALGVDRLVMLATGAEHISQVLWAPVQV